MITIVDYGIGNLGSIINMFRKVGVEAKVAADAKVIAGARKLVLPGVGSFDRGMRELRRSGLDEVIQRRVVDDGVPILGVCLGMQLLAQRSEEGSEPGLGWIDAEVARLQPSAGPDRLPVPHMGWNRLELVRPHPLFEGLEMDARYYFVHSYHVVCRDPAVPLTWTSYGQRFTSSVATRNVMGVQFHPEKSHRFGMRLFRNFAALTAESVAEQPAGSIASSPE